MKKDYNTWIFPFQSWIDHELRRGSSTEDNGHLRDSCHVVWSRDHPDRRMSGSSAKNVFGWCPTRHFTVVRARMVLVWLILKQLGGCVIYWTLGKKISNRILVNPPPPSPKEGRNFTRVRAMPVYPSSPWMRTFGLPFTHISGFVYAYVMFSSSTEH